MTIYWEEASPSVIDVAILLIGKYHDNLSSARIGFVFRSEYIQGKFGDEYAGVQLVSPKVRVHLDYDFIVWVGKDFWERAPAEKRTAALDHVLCHCGYDMDESRYFIRPHDLNDFIANIERFGFWDKPHQLERMKAAMQLNLPDIGTEHRGKIEAVAAKINNAPPLVKEAVLEILGRVGS